MKKKKKKKETDYAKLAKKANRAINALMQTRIVPEEKLNIQITI